MPRPSKKKRVAHLSLFPDITNNQPVVSSSSNPSVQRVAKVAEEKPRNARTFSTPKDLLDRYQVVTTNKHIAHEFQSFGCYLAETLADKPHTALYIKLAKQLPRAVLERALRFVIDSTADNKAKLFMWKLEQIKQGKKA